MWILELIKSRMTDKMKQRVIFHENHETLHSYIDKNNLPVEYGGKLEMDSIIKLYKQELEKVREIFMSRNQMSVNIELYPACVRDMSVDSLKRSIEEIIESEKKSKSYHFAIEEVRGSFKKLEID